MSRYLREAVSSAVPLALAYAEVVSPELPSAQFSTAGGRDQARGTAYSTYTTRSGPNNNSSDDGAVKDED